MGSEEDTQVYWIKQIVKVSKHYIHDGTRTEVSNPKDNHMTFRPNHVKVMYEELTGVQNHGNHMKSNPLLAKVSESLPQLESLAAPPYSLKNHLSASPCPS